MTILSPKVLPFFGGLIECVIQKDMAPVNSNKIADADASAAERRCRSVYPTQQMDASATILTVALAH